MSLNIAFLILKIIVSHFNGEIPCSVWMRIPRSSLMKSSYGD